MKYIALLLFWTLSLLLSAQKASTYYQTVADSIAITDVLSLIHQEGHLLLSYDPEIIPDGRIYLEAGDWSMVDLLKMVSSNTILEYKRVGKNYILTETEKYFYRLSGHVFDSRTGENLIGALIRIPGLAQGITTNSYGFFSLEIPMSRDSIHVSYLGYESQKVWMNNVDQTISIRLDESVALLETVIIESEEEESLITPQFGHLQLKAGQFDSPVGALGERDVLRQLQQTAGIAMTSESSSGFSVRGGRPNQNLILLDEAVVYNPTHFVGFFSIFNADALNKVDLYKGGVPSRYGGRIASVTNIMMREGNNQKLAIQGNINVLASSLSIEGPLKKDKGSFILSARRSYADLFLFQLSETRLSFLDLNLKLNFKLGEKDRIYVSGYIGEDRFSLPDQLFRFNWGNSTLTTRWNHVFNQRLFLNVSHVYSIYEYDLGAGNLDQSLNWTAELGSQTLKGDFNYFHSNNTQFNFGLSSTFHRIAPAFLSFVDLNDASLNESEELSKSFGLESALYGEVEHQLTPKMSILGGLRLSTFHNIGPATEYVFDENFNTVETIEHGATEFYNTYFNFEPRVSASYGFNNTTYLKGSYNRTVQYLSQASNSISGSPLDVWFLSSPNVQPQIADQVSLGYFKRLPGNSFNISIESFYRKIENEIDFKDNAALLLNDELERELRVGTARSYGVELTFQKQTGKLAGNVNFTWSRSLLDIPEVNGGLKYPSTYDRPINLTINPSYTFNKRITLSANWVFFSGLPFTSPTGRFTFGNVIVPSYSDRNEDRLPNYHRLDFVFELKNKNKKRKKYESSWSLAVYNVYNRQNANFISFQTERGTNQSEAVKYTVFGILPTVTYRFNF